MIKAGTTSNLPRDELKPPAWLALAQLLFAAVLLYVIRNPVPLETTTAFITREKPPPPITIRVPLSTVAVAAPTKQKIGEVPM